MDSLNSRHHSEMHGFVVNSTKVYRQDDKLKREMIVVSTSGYYKDDIIQVSFEGERQPWAKASNYNKIRE